MSTSTTLVGMLDSLRRSNGNVVGGGQSLLKLIQLVGPIPKHENVYSWPVPSVRNETRTQRERAQYRDGFFGGRAYRLYIPTQQPHDEASLVVMLHGAGQDHIEFAASTRMHELAGESGTFVLYPAQSQKENAARSWNWFKASNQERGAGEPAMLVALTREIVTEYAISPHRVYVSGMSAGAAMAVVLGQTYADVFAAVGVHSGLPYKVASEMYSAFNVMAHGPSGVPSHVGSGTCVPTIIFHGDQDTIVHHSNAPLIIEQVLGCTIAEAAVRASTATPAVPAGARAYTTTSYRDARGKPIVEHWTVHGGEHQWSGGVSNDSCSADPRGPDATKEMLRFFLAHRLNPRAVK